MNAGRWVAAGSAALLHSLVPEDFEVALTAVIEWKLDLHAKGPHPLSERQRVHLDALNRAYWPAIVKLQQRAARLHSLLLEEGLSREERTRLADLKGICQTPASDLHRRFVNRELELIRAWGDTPVQR